MRFNLTGCTCAIGLQVGTRKFLDTGIVASGVFGLVGWEEPCLEPVAVRCQLAIQGKPASYFWFACANPLHQRDAWAIEHFDSDGNVVRVSPGVRVFEEPYTAPSKPMLKAKRQRKAGARKSPK